MNQVKKLKQVENLSYFDRPTLGQIINVKKKALYENISRWVSQEKLIQLKNGLYVTSKYYNGLENKETYIEFIANRLRFPSYLSLEYILQKYSLISESVYAYTSVTLKTKNEYQNKLGRFIYRNISQDLFDGFEIKEKNGFEIKQASAAKALFDYLYLKFYRKKDINRALLNSLRLNLEELNSQDKSEFRGFCQKTNIEKFVKLPNLLFN